MNGSIGKKLDLYDISEIQLLYALSFVNWETSPFSWPLYPILLSRLIPIKISRDLVLLKLGWYKSNNGIPFNQSELIKTITVSTLQIFTIQKSNVKPMEMFLTEKFPCTINETCPSQLFEGLYLTLLKKIICGEYDAVFLDCQKYLLIDFVALNRYKEIFDEYKQLLNKQSLGCFTLEVLEELKILMGKLEKNEFQEALLNKTSCTSLMEQYAQFLNSPICHVDQRRLEAELLMYQIIVEPRLVNRNELMDTYRADQVFDYMLQDSMFLSYANATSSPLNYETLLNYILTWPDFSELKRLLFEAEQRFLEQEKHQFQELLRKIKCNDAIDLLMKISFDLENFLAWISTAEYSIWPVNAKVMAKKVFSIHSVCIQFRITASTQIADLLVLGINSIRKFFLNIIETSDVVPAKNQGHLVFSDNVNDRYSGRGVPSLDGPLLDKMRQTYGYEVYDKVYPSRNNAFLVTGNLSDYQSFKISYNENQILEHRKTSPCQSMKLGPDGLEYAYSHCLAKCENYYSQPKIAWQSWDGVFTYKWADCQYMPTGIPDETIRLPSVANCSYFSIMEQVWHKYSQHPGDYENKYSLHITNQQAIDCAYSCLKPCKIQERQITVSRKPANFLNYQMLLLSHLELSKNCSWNGPYNKSVTDSGFQEVQTLPCYDMGILVSEDEIQKVLCRYKKCVQRMEFEINTDAIFYEEKFTYQWHDMFGVVGGQIGLVMGASCLTFVQLLWVMIKTIYELWERRNYRKSYGTRLRSFPGPENAIIGMDDIPLVQLRRDGGKNEDVLQACRDGYENAGKLVERLEERLQRLDDILQNLSSLQHSEAAKEATE